MRASALHRLPRILISVGLMAALVDVFLHLPHVNDTTVALLLVLSIVGIALKWGSC